MSDYQFQIVMTSVDGEHIGTYAVDEQGLNDKWSDMIAKAEARRDIVLTLCKRFVDRNPDPIWLEIWRQQKDSFLMVTERMVVGKWVTIAEVNTAA